MSPFLSLNICLVLARSLRRLSSLFYIFLFFLIIFHFIFFCHPLDILNLSPERFFLPVRAWLSPLPFAREVQVLSWRGGSE